MASEGPGCRHIIGWATIAEWLAIAREQAIREAPLAPRPPEAGID
jgi:hypothetical protein